MASIKKDMQQLLRRLEGYGCTVTRNKKGHWKVLIPGGGIYFLSHSPSDNRALANAIADLRKKGVPL